MKLTREHGFRSEYQGSHAYKHCITFQGCDAEGSLIAKCTSLGSTEICQMERQFWQRYCDLKISGSEKTLAGLAIMPTCKDAACRRCCPHKYIHAILLILLKHTERKSTNNIPKGWLAISRPGWLCVVTVAARVAHSCAVPVGLGNQMHPQLLASNARGSGSGKHKTSHMIFINKAAKQGASSFL